MLFLWCSDCNDKVRVLVSSLIMMGHELLDAILCFITSRIYHNKLYTQLLNAAKETKGLCLCSMSLLIFSANRHLHFLLSSFSFR